MRIEVHIPRPLSLVMGFLAITGWVLWLNDTPLPGFTGASVSEQSSSSSVSSEMGGYDPQTTKQLVSAEEQAYFARQLYSTIEKKEELLRYELRALEDEMTALGSTITEEQQEEFTKARTNLVKLLQDKRAAAEAITTSLEQVWKAREEGAKISIQTSGAVPSLIWPVDAVYGISATFRDPEYEKHFGFKHDGVDMPVMQGTALKAVADGVVDKAVDNGLGYSYIIVRHQGIATLYGHVSQINVYEGQVVRQGELLGLSGGRPGTKGAGKNTTGPHLHFEVIKGGERIDPLTVLPVL